MKLDMSFGNSLNVSCWSGDDDMHAINELAIFLSAAGDFYAMKGQEETAKAARKASDQLYRGLLQQGFFDQYAIDVTALITGGAEK